MSAIANIILGGVFHAAVLFMVAAGLQLVFGVQKIVNLACGSFYALGAYFGITLVSVALKAGLPSVLLLPILVIAGVVMATIGPVIERLLRSVYDRDESFQLLLTFALVLMFQDIIRFIWGANPQSLDNVYLRYWNGHFLLFVGYTITACFIGLLVLGVAVAGSQSMSRALFANTPMLYLGVISYSLYLWHVPIQQWTMKLLDYFLVTGDRLGWLVAISVPLSILAATISYWLIERPFLSRRPRPGT